MSKAPEGMPTETIRAFVQNAENKLADWQEVERSAYERLQRAIREQENCQRNVSEYKGWLWDRENNA